MTEHLNYVARDRDPRDTQRRALAAIVEHGTLTRRQLQALLFEDAPEIWRASWTGAALVHLYDAGLVARVREGYGRSWKATEAGRLHAQGVSVFHPSLQPKDAG